MTLKELQQTYNKYCNIINTLNYYDARKSAGHVVSAEKYTALKKEATDLSRRFKKISHLFEFELKTYIYKCIDILNKYESDSNWSYTYISTSSNQAAPYTYKIVLHNESGKQLTLADISLAKPLSYADNTTVNLLCDTYEPFDLCTESFSENVTYQTSKELRQYAWQIVAQKQRRIVCDRREKIDLQVAATRNKLSKLVEQQSKAHQQPVDNFDF